MAATDHPVSSSPPPEEGATAAADQSGQPGQSQPAHNFAAQKEIHRRIRNDPDYDDWEYGTEPLPQEAWLEPAATASVDDAAADVSGTPPGSASEPPGAP